MVVILGQVSRRLFSHTFWLIAPGQHPMGSSE